MISLRDIRYARLGTTDIDSAATYAKRILGLEEVRRTSRAVYLRGADVDHTLVYFNGDPADHTAGWQLTTNEELDAAAAHLEALGVAVHRGTAGECDERACGAFIGFRDPSGGKHELVARPHASGVRYFPSRDAGIWAFSHIGLHTSDPARDETFWTTVFNAKVSDRIGPAGLLRIDEVHHKMALFPSAHGGIQHINHQVRDLNDIMRSYYFLREQGVRIVFGPGRHPTSGAIFLYFEGPDKMVYEYSTGVRLITVEDEKTYVPRQFPFEASSFCMWGSRPDIPEFQTKDKHGEESGTQAGGEGVAGQAERGGSQGARRQAA
jgi:2,3-dihydroxy-p-cumate/2,3-dihydroxybenzoate 3,4-dioxygenase